MAKATTTLPIETDKNSSTFPKRLSPFETLRREIDHLFDHFPTFDWQGPPRLAFFGPEAEWPRGPGWGIVPAMDLAERDDAYEISAELPGLDEEDIEIKLSNGTLTIRGEKTEESEEREKEYYLSERRYGSFHRSFQVPEGVDTDRIDATFAKGVLTVTLPKSMEAQKNEKKIGVKAA